MAKTPSISAAQWEVMNVIWAEGPVTAAQVVEQLSGRTGWNPRTTKTLLNRLVNKKALSFQKRGKEYVYRAAVAREQCVRSESRGFLRRVFNGAPGPMLVHFVSRAKLTDEEIEQLKEILSRKGK